MNYHNGEDTNADYKTVYDYDATWEADGTTDPVDDLLRRQTQGANERATDRCDHRCAELRREAVECDEWNLLHPNEQ